MLLLDFEIVGGHSSQGNQFCVSYKFTVNYCNVIVNQGKLGGLTRNFNSSQCFGSFRDCRFSFYFCVLWYPKIPLAPNIYLTCFYLSVLPVAFMFRAKRIRSDMPVFKQYAFCIAIDFQLVKIKSSYEPTCEYKTLYKKDYSPKKIMVYRCFEYGPRV